VISPPETVHDRVDLAEIGEGLVHDLFVAVVSVTSRWTSHSRSAVFGFEINLRVHLADGTGDSVAALQKLLGHVAAEAAAHSGDKPGS